MLKEARAAIHALTNPQRQLLATDAKEIQRLNGLATSLRPSLETVLVVVPFTEDLALICFYTFPDSRRKPHFR